MMTDGSLLGKHFENYFSNIVYEPSQTIEEVTETEEYIPEFIHGKQLLEDALPIVEANGFYQINFLGGQGNGKTSAAEEICTVLKEEHGYLLVFAKPDDILPDQKKWIEKVKQAIDEHGDVHLCLVLDDMSYATGMISDKKAATFKNFIGNIRHEFEEVLGKIKILLIMITHRYHSVPPMLRKSSSYIFASMDNEDRADAMKMIPRNKTEQEHLDQIYKFLLQVTAEGPKNREIVLSDGQGSFKFKWGIEGDPGDGRLMMLFHRGKMQIYNPRVDEDKISLEDYRFKYEPPTEEELAQQKEEKKEIFRQKAVEITNKLNKSKNESMAIVPLREAQKSW